MRSRNTTCARTRFFLITPKYNQQRSNYSLRTNHRAPLQIGRTNSIFIVQVFARSSVFDLLQCFICIVCVLCRNDYMIFKRCTQIDCRKRRRAPGQFDHIELLAIVLFSFAGRWLIFHTVDFHNFCFSFAVEFHFKPEKNYFPNAFFSPFNTLNTLEFMFNSWAVQGNFPLFIFISRPTMQILHFEKNKQNQFAQN